MVKFFRVNQDAVLRQVNAIKIQLQVNPVFSDSIDQHEEVIIAAPHDGEDVLKNAKDAAAQNPESRVIILFDEKRNVDADLSFLIGREGMDYAGKNDTQGFTEKVALHYSKKKDLAFYIKQEPAESLYAHAENGYIQLEGLKNDVIIGKSPLLIKSLQNLAYYKRHMERLELKNNSLSKSEKRDSQITLLITGENGSGKGELGKLWASNFSSRKFIEHNMAGLSDDLLASELFGSIKGSFTGSYRDVPGILKANEKGITALDEFGEISLQSQAKFLRLLQQKEYRRVGDDQIQKFEGQLLLVTNKDLAKAVKNGTFREDLYHRVKNFHVHMPSLRERREDIQLIAESLFEKHSIDNQVTTAAMDLLGQQDWPGNVRQLEGFIQNLCIHHEGMIDSSMVRDMMVDYNKTDNQFKIQGLQNVHALGDGVEIKHKDVRESLIENATRDVGYLDRGSKVDFYQALQLAYKTGKGNHKADELIIKTADGQDVQIFMNREIEYYSVNDALNMAEANLYNEIRQLIDSKEPGHEAFINSKENFLTISNEGLTPAVGIDKSEGQENKMVLIARGTDGDPEETYTYEMWQKGEKFIERVAAHSSPLEPDETTGSFDGSIISIDRITEKEFTKDEALELILQEPVYNLNIKVDLEKIFGPEFVKRAIEKTEDAAPVKETINQERPEVSTFIGRQNIDRHNQMSF